METKAPMQIDLVPYNKVTVQDAFDLDRIIFDLDTQIDTLSSRPDNLEYHKTCNDIYCTKIPIGNERIQLLKMDWLDEWQKYIAAGFASFLQVEGAELHWYSGLEMMEKVGENNPGGTWFRLVLLEAMLFEPYYPLGIEKNKKGTDVPSRKYNDLQNPISGYKKDQGDAYLDALFIGEYYTRGYIKRLRKCYDKVQWELNEVLKTAFNFVVVTAGITILAIVAAGAFAPAILKAPCGCARNLPQR